jgi:hypothetical protein
MATIGFVNEKLNGAISSPGIIRSIDIEKKSLIQYF